MATKAVKKAVKAPKLTVPRRAPERAPKPVKPDPEAPKPEPAPEPDYGEVGRLLDQSMKLHIEARAQKGRRPDSWKQSMFDAWQLRKRAYDMDPQQTAQAWEVQQGHTGVGVDTHRQMMRFYASLGFAD